MSEEQKKNESGRTEERSHHEHHHGEHHHKHHHRKKKKKRKPIPLPKFMKTKKFWVNMGIILGTVILLAAIGLLAKHRQSEGTLTPGSASGKQWSEGQNVSISVSFFDEAVPLVGEAVSALTEAEWQTPADDVLKPYRNDKFRLDVSSPVILNYDITGLGAAHAVVGATVEVSETEDFRKPLVIERDHVRSIKISNLKTGTEYFYRINIAVSNGQTLAVQGSFQTAKSPRILSVEGAVNVRDIGGWKTGNGETVRQGMIYRGSELDGAVESSFKLTSAGMETMLQTLGIRKDLDLRAESENPYGIDALGAGVEHIYFDMPMYAELFTEQGKAKVGELFSLLAEESNYPVYIHCTYGLDRTGTVCALLEALLGVGKDDILMDYRLSGLYHKNIPQNSMEDFLVQLEACPGYNLQEKAEKFLLSAGVTEEEITEIRRIMLQ